MEPANKEDSRGSERYCAYKDLLEAVVMIPFRSLGFLSSGTVFPVLLDQVRAEVDRDTGITTRYAINLSYGRTRWRVTHNVVHIFSLNAYLCYKGIEGLMRDRLGMVDERHACVEAFLANVLRGARLLDMGRVYDFFGISRHSFVGEKRFEGKFFVQISERQEGCNQCSTGCHISAYFRKMYIVCKMTHLVFVDYKNGHRDVDVLFYTGELAVDTMRHAFHSSAVVVGHWKRFVIKSFDHDCVSLLAQGLAEGEARLRERRFLSFSPVRRDNIVNFYVDGRNYFENLYDTLRLARSEIFIAGWWVYPTLYLKRRLRNGRLRRRYRLDYVLKRLAEDGIRIRILLYREFQMALNINSGFTYEFLSRLHSNIEILRHPGTGHVPVYWSHHEKVVVIDQRTAYLGGMDLTLGRYDTQEHVLFDRKTRPKNEAGLLRPAALHIMKNMDLREQSSVWPGIDFCNPLKKDFVNVENGEKSLIDRAVTPRMPWHDIQCKVVGESALDVARHFIERWNFTAQLDESMRVDLLVPNEELLDLRSCDGQGQALTQVLRSVGGWSLDARTENSIARAYSEVISGARRFIYIENQFFITNCDGTAEGCPENTIGADLACRIIRAHRESERFKVYVLIPLLPAFETNFSTNASSSVREIMRAQLQSISRGRRSLFQVLRKHGVDPARYIAFMSLRKAHFDGQRISQEQIYIHSKLIIADGTTAVVGSANFNDRSMLGDRDSEIALFVEDTQVGSLLRRLLAEHLGIGGRRKKYPDGCGFEEASVDAFLEEMFAGTQPLRLEDNDVFDAMTARAEINTRIFRELFRSLPDDDVRTAADYLEFVKQRPLYSMDVDRDVIQSIFLRIRGHLVLFPHNFLSDEEVHSGFLSIQGLIPSVVFY